MESRLEQRAAIKMCVRAGETVKNTIQKLSTAWGADAIGVTQICFWFRRFQEDPNRHTKDQKHSGRPITKRTQKTVQAVEVKLADDCRATVRQVAASCDIGKTTTHKILRKDLRMTKLAPKFVPRILTAAQRQTNKVDPLLILYFDSHGPILTYFHDDGTVDSEVYMQSIREMREAV